MRIESIVRLGKYGMALHVPNEMVMTMVCDGG